MNSEMATPQTSPVESTDSSPRDLTALFPALHLLRASGLAIDPRKMLLGGVALILLAGRNRLFNFLPFAPDSSSVQIATGHEPTVVSRMLSCVGFIRQPPIDAWLSWDAAAFSLFTPVRTLVEPARAILHINQPWSVLAFAWTQLLWTLIVWSLVGGALCRMNALQFATKKRIGIFEALKFSRRQLLGYLIAPLLPLSAVLILMGFNWLLGLVASLAPSLGVMALSIAWGLVLFCGFLMTMLVLGIATGWPLMIAAISTEDSDGFDGLSRAFGYLFDRPWHAALFAVFSLPIFAACRILVAILIGLTVSLAANAVAEGGGVEVKQLMSRLGDIGHDSLAGPAGRVVGKLDAAVTGTGRFPWPGSMSEGAVIAWTCIPALLYVGFGPSFFWSATTVTYFLLRKSDDGTPLDSVVDWPAKSDSDAAVDPAGATDSSSPAASQDSP
jgi:hypothetical protein